MSLYTLASCIYLEANDLASTPALIVSTLNTPVTAVKFRDPGSFPNGYKKKKKNLKTKHKLKK